MLGPALLFCPADRPERYLKAAAVADSVILDLEDAVAPADKATARAHLVAHSASAGALDPERTIVRVNPFGTPDHELDLVAVAQTPYRTLMLAKAEDARQLDALGQAGYAVVALCETALGISRVADIAAHPAVFGLMWGAEDLTASMGGQSARYAPAPGQSTGMYRDFARFARARLLLEAKAAGKQAIDAVFVTFSDAEGLKAEVSDALASGFDATACIHPSQAAIIREGYAPTADQRDWAERVLDEATRQPGVFRFEGKMIDEPVLRQARAMLGDQRLS